MQELAPCAATVVMIMTENSSELAQYYIQCMLKKTGQNKGLTERLLKKLFVELVKQIESLEQVLATGDMAQAKAISHKIAGAVSFCGFVEIQQLAKALENIVVTEQRDPSSVEFVALKAKITEFLGLETEIFQQLSQG